MIVTDKLYKNGNVIKHLTIQNIDNTGVLDHEICTITTTDDFSNNGAFLKIYNNDHVIKGILYNGVSNYQPEKKLLCLYSSLHGQDFIDSIQNNPVFEYKDLIPSYSLFNTDIASFTEIVKSLSDDSNIGGQLYFDNINDTINIEEGSKSRFQLLSLLNKNKIIDLPTSINILPFNLNQTTYQPLKFIKLPSEGNDITFNYILRGKTSNNKIFNFDVIFKAKKINGSYFFDIINQSSSLNDNIYIRLLTVTQSDVDWLKVEIKSDTMIITISDYILNAYRNIDLTNEIKTNILGSTVINNINGSTDILITNDFYHLSNSSYQEFGTESTPTPTTPQAVQIPDGYNIFNYTVPGYYYKNSNISTLVGIPKNLTGLFVMYIYDSGTSHPLHCIIKDNNNNLHLGFSNGVKYVWKSIILNFDENGNLILPNHNHLWSGIITDDNHNFVSQSQINLWNSLANTNQIWSTEIIPAIGNVIVIDQTPYTKPIIQIQSGLTIPGNQQVIIVNAQDGMKGEFIVENLSDVEDYTVAVSFSNISKVYCNLPNTNIELLASDEETVRYSALVRYHKMINNYVDIEIIPNNSKMLASEVVGENETVVGQGNQTV